MAFNKLLGILNEEEIGVQSKQNASRRREHQGVAEQGLEWPRDKSGPDVDEE